MFNDLRKQVDSKLVECFDQYEFWLNLKAGFPEMHSAIRSYLLRPGKRLRPLLFLLSARAYGAPRDEHGLKISAALELIHDFVLIHDDVMDRSDLRRNKPSLHKIFAGFINDGIQVPAKTGEGLAILAGDLIYTMAVDLLCNGGLPAKFVSKGMEMFTAAAFATGEGQFKDVMLDLKMVEQLDEQNIFELYRLKTAVYSFVYPLKLGAYFSGCESEGELQKLEKLGELLGIGYQILDDLEEFDNSNHNNSDIIERKKTIIVCWACQMADNSQKEFLREYYNSQSPLAPDAVAQMIIATGAIDYARNQVHEMKQQAMTMISELSCREKAQRLKDFVDEIIPVN
jgi:geranylgeranyl diphosphate synthase type I